jgi:hypothetical protein
VAAGGRVGRHSLMRNGLPGGGITPLTSLLANSSRDCRALVAIVSAAGLSCLESRRPSNA